MRAACGGLLGLTSWVVPLQIGLGVETAEVETAAELASALVADAIEAEAAGEFLMRQRLLVEAERATTAYAPDKWLTGPMQDSQGKWEEGD